MTALSSLLMSRPADEDLQKAWVRAMLPLAGDPEQTCQVYELRSIFFSSMDDLACGNFFPLTGGLSGWFEVLNNKITITI